MAQQGGVQAEGTRNVHIKNKHINSYSSYCWKQWTGKNYYRSL